MTVSNDRNLNYWAAFSIRKNEDCSWEKQLDRINWSIKYWRISHYFQSRICGTRIKITLQLLPRKLHDWTNFRQFLVWVVRWNMSRFVSIKPLLRCFLGNKTCTLMQYPMYALKIGSLHSCGKTKWAMKIMNSKCLRLESIFVCKLSFNLAVESTRSEYS